METLLPRTPLRSYRERKSDHTESMNAFIPRAPLRSRYERFSSLIRDRYRASYERPLITLPIPLRYDRLYPAQILFTFGDVCTIVPS